MNILVTGSNGQLGRCIQSTLSKVPTTHRFIFSSRHGGVTPSGTFVHMLDITDPDAVNTLIDQLEIDMVINCAAYTAVDKAETDHSSAYAINVTGPRNLANAMLRRNGWLIHFSTDYVFDGNSTTPYTEDSPTSPLSVYGKTKLEGEQAISESGCSHMIFRTSWLYSEFSHNFLLTMTSLLNSDKPEIRVVADQTGTPTYAGEIAHRIIDRIIPNPKQGIYNLTNSDSTTWHGFATEIRNTLVPWSETEIYAITTPEYPTPATRPQFSVLNNTKTYETFGFMMSNWKTAMRACANNVQKIALSKFLYDRE